MSVVLYWSDRAGRPGEEQRRMSMVGGNLDQLDGLERSFRNESQNVGQLVGRITATLNGTTWLGPAAQRFKSDWTQNFSRSLQQLQQALDQQAAYVANRRQAIATATN
jgi:uncharacterized protein YukE